MNEMKVAVNNSPEETLAASRRQFATRPGRCLPNEPATSLSACYAHFAQRFLATRCM